MSTSTLTPGHRRLLTHLIRFRNTPPTALQLLPHFLKMIAIYAVFAIPLVWLAIEQDRIWLATFVVGLFTGALLRSVGVQRQGNHNLLLIYEILDWEEVHRLGVEHHIPGAEENFDSPRNTSAPA